MTAIQLTDVWFAYGADPVVQGVSLTVEPGERVGLLGPNGAGKTTLTKLLVGLLHPRGGEVRIGGTSTRGKAPEDLAGVVGYVFQHADQQLFARTVVEEVAFGPRELGRSTAEVDHHVEAALELSGLDALRGAHPYDLPAPERKLVALAAALAQRPKVLVLDEPTQGLDRGSAARVGEIVRHVATTGVAVIAVTHDLGFLAESFERAVVMRDGEIVADEPAARLLSDEGRARGLGLALPVAARLSAALGLPGRPVKVGEVVRALQGLKHVSGGPS